MAANPPPGMGAAGGARDDVDVHATITIAQAAVANVRTDDGPSPVILSS